MKSFVYPAIFIKDKDADLYRVLFPDFDITTDGTFVEEAFVYAEEMLKAYFAYILKYDLDFNEPTEYDKVRASCEEGDIVMLIDAQVEDEEEE